MHDEKLVCLIKKSHWNSGDRKDHTPTVHRTPSAPSLRIRFLSMTSVWDWILLSIQHRLQGLVVLGGDNPSWNAGSRSPCSCSLPALWLPQNRKGRCSGTFPAPPPQTSLLSRSRGPAEASPELHHSQLPPSSRGTSKCTTSAHSEG